MNTHCVETVKKYASSDSSTASQTLTYGYDAYGNVTSGTLTASGTDEKITSSSSYIENGNFASAVTDTLGGITSYGYDSKKLLSYVQNALNNRTDVIIVDYRTKKEPDMQIKQSYKIKNKDHQKEIAQIMYNYNASNPVNPAWNRSVDSLVEEWGIHNTVYGIGLFRSSTADCDFDNKDEGKGYWDFFAERVLK